MTKIRVKTGKPAKRPVSPTLILLVIGAAILIVGGAIVLSNQFTRVDVSQFPTKGQTNAPVVMVEYVDYGCSHCRDFTLERFPLLDAEFIETGKVKFIVHPYYLGNPAMGLAAEAAWCAADQGKFFEYHHALFEKSEATASQDTLIELAATLELDKSAFTQCLSSRKHQSGLEQATQSASNRGINSTPTFFINNRRILGNEPYEVFQRIINQELGKTQ